MVTKGWKQRKHKRTSKTGKSFNAGRKDVFTVIGRKVDSTSRARVEKNKIKRSTVTNELRAKADHYSSIVYHALQDAQVDFDDLGDRIDAKNRDVIVDIYTRTRGVHIKTIDVKEALDKANVEWCGIGGDEKKHAYVVIDWDVL
jgi:hypothetical protein